jgi:hypothetical protein
MCILEGLREARSLERARVQRCKNYMQTLPVSRSQLQVYLLHAIELHANMAGVGVTRSWQQGSLHGA